MRCRWCDTKYAWDEEAGTEQNIAEIVQTVQEWPCRFVVITEAREAEKAEEAHANATKEALNKNRGHVGLLNHRKGWIGRATKGVAEAKEKLKQAEAMTGDTEQKAKAVKEAQEASQDKWFDVAHHTLGLFWVCFSVHGP